MSGLHQTAAYNCKNLFAPLFVRLSATSRLILLTLLLSLGIGGLFARSIARTMDTFD